ncbi:penicillin-binding transpeptidase domain-containing protein [Streptomyces sp. H10-C2]|uniref:penicillin-binding transpeptidase domain-containing protein n=1 Tax=unclassified Streptomyces TaxID=2593676 RepID=UPI0024BBD36B|nr:MULTISPECIES: penicillin-binding transpeptidase domain-containing protein [unclassified Streptomyces]MDJ0342541.1 penicillin-binding transpeptidase domain-containing protein [Streptomyces sp. PH10-H1]MDJ0370562.1 penicillin-binding transpeptidase domain-containing protein [Streptomyces sp. H10-C2]
MTRYIRRAAAFCLVLLAALLLNAGRVQVVQTGSYDGNPANRRSVISRYDRPRGNIMIADASATGSRATGGRLKYLRTYAQGPLYAPVTGYASQTYGTRLLEGTEDGVLSGTDARLSSLPLWNEITRSRQKGGDLHTTINPAAQQAAFAGLGNRKGAVAALDPATGRILALVSSPSYDPATIAGTGKAVNAAWTRLNADVEQPMLNRAIRQTYPPGSTFKVITAAAALEHSKVPDVKAATVSPDPYPLPGTRTELTNEAGACSDATLLVAFAVSCNTVFAKLGVDVGLSGMVKQAQAFGFNDVNLRIPPSVVPSNFDTGMSPDQLALSSIGQFDTTATPLQMAMVAAAVANGGELMSPYLVERITNSNGATVSTTTAHPLHQAVSPTTATQLQQLMEAVVTSGTGGKAAIPGIAVGGKTGTAQHGIGNTGMPYAWFISYAKTSGGQPAVAVAVVLEDAEAARSDISGGGSAAPIARDVMKAVLG